MRISLKKKIEIEIEFDKIGEICFERKIVDGNTMVVDFFQEKR